MKREILFRGKRKDNGEWVKGSFTTRVGENKLYFDVIHTINGYTEDEYLVITKTVGQYTGIKDNHNTKIFEDDIIAVRYENKFRKIFATGIVVFRNCQFTTKIIKNESFWKTNNRYDPGFDNTNLLRQHPNEIKIIDNIHDNPELLEETK